MPGKRVSGLLVFPSLPLLYLAVPGHPLGLLGGIPLDPLALGAALTCCLLAWCGCAPPRRAMLALALLMGTAVAARVMVASLALPYGLLASYTASGAPDGPPERSTMWHIDNATRVDRALNFVGDSFPLHFFNDVRRFNFYTPSQPRRDLLPFAVTWRGWLIEAPACVHLEATGAASLRLDGAPAVAVERATHLERREQCGFQSGGTLPIEVRYIRPEGGVPALTLAEVASDGSDRPLGPERFLRAPADPDGIARDRTLGAGARILDVVVLLAAAAWGVATCAAGALTSRLRQPSVRLDRLVLAISVVAAFAEGFVAYRHFAGRTAVLSGGNDWLAYESYARDVLLNGPLMTGGKPLGQGETFYYQPLYSYFLAALHLMLGESLHGVLVAQYVLVAATGVLTYFLARELFGRAAAWATFGMFWALRYLVFNQVAGLLLSENLVAAIIPGMLLLLARWHRGWRRADLLGGGALLGLAILTRSTPLLFLPPALMLVALAQRRKFGQWKPAFGAAILLLAVTMGVSSLVGVRNLVVAGRPALLPESVSANLWEAHRPSAKVDLSGIDRTPLYHALNLDRQTREVLEFARQDPLGYAGTLAVMGLYALGITGPALGTAQLQYELVLLSALYVAGTLLSPAARRGPVWLVHGFVLTHFLQMMIFMSHQYGFRLPLPMYGPMTVVAGAALAALGAWIGHRFRSAVAPRTKWAAAGAGVAVFAAISWTSWRIATPSEIEGAVFGLGGDAGPAARAARESPAAWQADRLFFSGRDGRSFGVAYLPGLAYREMSWLDGSRALALLPDGRRGVLISDVGEAAPLIESCSAVDGPTPSIVGDRRIQELPRATESPCAPNGRRLASFGGFVEVLQMRRESTESVLVAWRVLLRPSFRVQPVVERVDDGGGIQATLASDPYPSGSWQPGELVIARLTVPGPSGMSAATTRLALGFRRDSPSGRLLIDDPLSLYGQVRVLSPAT